MLGFLLFITSAVARTGTTLGSCRTPIVLGAGASALKEAFNRDKGSVRLLFLIDPICPSCLRGAEQMSRHVLDRHGSNPRLKSRMVHMPVLGGTEKDTRRACKHVTGGLVTHYWDPKGGFGGMVSNGVNLRDSKGNWIYAWDVWLLYGPEAEWTGTNPPPPTVLMHQLVALKDATSYDFFDPEKFAAAVGESLRSIDAAKARGAQK